jgi:predicted dehydrogenase
VTARIGVVGAGFWAAYHYLPFFREHPDVELVGIVRKTEDGLDAFKREFGLEVATTSVDELLAAGVDGVVVSSPHSLHREHAVTALAGGAHVLVEKPMAVKLADAEAIAATARSTGRTAAVALGWNHARLSIWAKEMLDAGRIGRVTSVTAYKASSLTAVFSGRSGYGVVDVAGFPVEAEASTWARSEAGGGYLYGQLSHLLGLGLWLVPAEPEEVFARASFLPNGCDLDVQLSIELADGVIASFNGQGRRPWAIRHSFDLRIAGEEGVLELDMEHVRAELLLQGDLEAAEVLHVGPDPPPRDEEGMYSCDGPAQYLVDVCLGRDVPNRAPAELGVRTVAVMEAAWRSAHLHEPVRIEALRAGAAA